MQIIQKQDRRLIQIDVRNLFGLKDVSSPVIWSAYDIKYDNVPESNQNYVFEKLSLIEFETFMSSSSIALQIIGHTGSGKSSFVEEFHARLNLSLYVVNAHPRTTQADLIGDYIPTKDGTLQFCFGPLAKAAIEGCSVLIDEYNVLDPAEATGLNALLEGRSIFVREINGWIHPKEGFKIITTINKKGAGYIGRNTQDAANEDRFACMYMDYISEENEIALVKNYLAEAMSLEVAEVLAIKFRTVAAQIRSLYMGEDDSGDALEMTISTRSLLRWVELFMMYQNIKMSPYNYEPVHFALERAQTFKASDSTRMAIHNYVEQIFGDPYVTPTHPQI